MAVKYLKKKELYRRAQSLIEETLPLSKDFTYRSYRGNEKISGGDYEICSQCYGNWIKIVHKKYDEKQDTFVCDEQIFADYKGGKYLYEGNKYKWIEE